MFESCNLLALQSIEDQHSIDLACPQREMKVHLAVLEITCSQHAESLADVGFLNRDYRYKSVAKQNPSRCWIGTDPIHWPTTSSQHRMS